MFFLQFTPTHAALITTHTAAALYARCPKVILQRNKSITEKTKKMKLAILLFGTFITGMITLSAPVKNISGTWVIQSAPGTCSPAVIRISMDEGVWVGKMDIPEQQVYDKDVYAIAVDGDSMLISVSESGNSINAKLETDNSLKGTLVTDNSNTPVLLVKR